jgi:hypothetical protein
MREKHVICLRTFVCTLTRHELCKPHLASRRVKNKFVFVYPATLCPIGVYLVGWSVKSNNFPPLLTLPFDEDGLWHCAFLVRR